VTQIQIRQQMGIPIRVTFNDFWYKSPIYLVEDTVMDSDLKKLIEAAIAESDKARDKARLNRLKSPEFLTLTAMTLASLLSLLFLFSDNQINQTSAWQVMISWACLMVGMMASVQAIFTPDRIKVRA